MGGRLRGFEEGRNKRLSENELIARPADVLDRLLMRVREQPDVAAVEDPEFACSYERLATLAFRVATTIRQAAESPCPRVLVAMSSSHRAYAAMVGTLVAGGTFCPVDLCGPEGRNAAICLSFAPDVVIFENSVPAFLSALPVTTPRLDISRELAEAESGPCRERSDVAYVMFTTGSTGRPKGIKIGRRGFSYFLEAAEAHFWLSPGERWGQYSSLGHDLGVMDVFMALTLGGTLVPLSEADRHVRPAVAIRNRQLSIWQSVPSVLDFMILAGQLTAEYLASLRVMSFCGDALHARHLEALFNARPDLYVYNTFGTTETLGFNTLNHLTKDNYKESCDEAGVSIGDDVPGWSLHLQGGDDRDEGEIVVASEHLSLGYWQDEERTRAAFRNVELNGQPARRCYFTGDWGVRRSGRLYCVGRMDRQLKIQGVRIDLEEVDELLRHIGFPAAYTVSKNGKLYAFVETTKTVDLDEVRKRLLNSLPVQAVPSAIRVVSSLPRQNGKVDREALLQQLES